MKPIVFTIAAVTAAAGSAQAQSVSFSGLELSGGEPGSVAVIAAPADPSTAIFTFQITSIAFIVNIFGNDETIQLVGPGLVFNPDDLRLTGPAAGAPGSTLLTADFIFDPVDDDGIDPAIAFTLAVSILADGSFDFAINDVFVGEFPAGSGDPLGLPGSQSPSSFLFSGFASVPSPGPMALAGLLGLAAARRRR